MSHWVLTENGRVKSITTVQLITNLELGTIDVKVRCKHYNECIADYSTIRRRLEDCWDEYTQESDEDFANELSNALSDSNT